MRIIKEVLRWIAALLIVIFLPLILVFGLIKAFKEEVLEGKE